MTNDKAAEIARLNDQLRTYNLKGFFMTRGVASFSQTEQEAILEKVRTFHDFTPDNDPYGEHDFGSFDFKGNKIFWKIDYYADKECRQGAEDPSDASVFRVITVMLASEY